MRLAKPAVDVGLSSNLAAEQLAFWRDRVGLAVDECLPVAPGQVQHRFHANGSIIKVNLFDEPLTPVLAAGYREVMIARPGLDHPVRLTDPDGAVVSLIPPGVLGIDRIGIRMAVRDLAAHRRFFAEVLELPEEGPGCFRAGDSLFLVEPDSGEIPDAPTGGAGWRYVTFQVFDAQAEHARALARGAEEARAPALLGDVARFSIIRDPDGNAIELSQRASIVGSLE